MAILSTERAVAVSGMSARPSRRWLLSAAALASLSGAGAWQAALHRPIAPPVPAPAATGRIKEGFTMSHLPRILRRLALGFALVSTLALGVIGAPAASADASAVPVRATLAETIAPNPLCAPNTRCTAIAGSGQATHLGHTTETAAVVSSITIALPGGCNPESRTTTLTASNGDTLTLAATGTNCPASVPTMKTAFDNYTVTGGTGRFADASGSGTISAAIDLATRTAVVTISGTLSAPGA